jgi:hypothetical protein
MNLVIVGGVAGGASAARTRRLSEASEIVLFERGPDVSFADCGLPYYVGGEIAERDKLLVMTPERLRDRFRLDVRVRTSVESIDRKARTVRARALATGREYDEPYDRLILASGAAPVWPQVPGIDLPGIFTLRDLRDGTGSRSGSTGASFGISSCRTRLVRPCSVTGVRSLPSSWRPSLTLTSTRPWAASSPLPRCSWPSWSLPDT